MTACEEPSQTVGDLSLGLAQNCPVCDCKTVGFVRHVQTIRTRRLVRLFGCFRCGSFWNPSGYTESDDVLRADVEWHKSVCDRNTASAVDLLDALALRNVDCSSVCDIGCGIGTLVRAVTDRGGQAIGFDTNRHAIAYGKTVDNADIRNDFWMPTSLTVKATLYTCIMVCEHLDMPRSLLRDLCVSAARDGASLFISVPFLEESRWHFISDPDPKQPGMPFFDNDVHITHFSVRGMTLCLTEFGAKSVTFLSGGIWYGALVSEWDTSKSEIKLG